MSGSPAPHRLAGRLGLVVLLIGAVATADGARAAGTAPAPDPERTVLVGAPGLAWSDLDPVTTPILVRLAEEGSVASMTVRAVRARSCAVDGWLTLSAGRRAADAPGPCREPEAPTDGVVPGWEDYRAAAAEESYGAVPGTLGERVDGVGACVEAVGPGAAVAAADTAGRVARYTDALPDRFGCPVVLVDAGTLPAGGAARTTALRELDALVADVVDAAGPGSTVAVAGVGDGLSPVAPRALVVSGPPVGVVTAASTRQDGLVQLQDLTASLLGGVGADDSGLTGRPVTVVPGGAPAADRLDARTAFERRASTMRGVAPQVTGWLAALFTAWAITVAVLAWRRRAPSAGLRVAGVALSTVPLATFLANLLPWWRLDPAWPGFVVGLAVAVGVTSWLALLAGRRLDLGALRAVAVTTLAVLAGDVLLGSRLQLASVFGQNPVVGGRFYGLGNTSFALYGLAALVVVQWVASASRLSRAWALSLAAGILLLTLGLEAHPSLGADFGGPPGLLLGGLVVLAAAAGVRLTPARVVIAVAVAAGVAVGVAVADWLRPPEVRTHLGDFVETVLDGGAGQVVSRKVAQNLANLGSPPLLAVAVSTAVLALVLWRTGWRPGRDGGVVLRGATVMAGVGLLVNDSGLVIPAFVAVVLAPLLLADRAAPVPAGGSVRGPVGRLDELDEDPARVLGVDEVDP